MVGEITYCATKVGDHHALLSKRDENDRFVVIKFDLYVGR